MSIDSIINDLANNPSSYSVNDLKNLALGQSTTLQGKDGTILYSGVVGDTKSETIALNQANQNNLAIINDTDAARLVSSDEFQSALLNATGEDIDALDNPNSESHKFLYGSQDANGNRAPDGLWDDLSKEFVKNNAEGDVTVIGPFAAEDRVFAQTELPELLNNPNVDSINGVDKGDIPAGGDSLNAVKQSSVTKLSGLDASDLGIDLSGAELLKTDTRWDDLLDHMTNNRLLSESTLKKLGVAGELLSLALVVNEANASSQAGDNIGAAQTLTEWTGGLLGGIGGGSIATTLTATALTGLAAASTPGLVAAGVLTFGMGFVGGVLGGEALEELVGELFDKAKELGLLDDNVENDNAGAMDEVHRELLRHSDTDTLKDNLNNNGSNPVELLERMSDDTNKSETELLNEHKEFFGQMFDTPPDYEAITRPDGKIILEGENNLDTVIDPVTDDVHINIPHNVATGDQPSPALPASDALTNSPILSGLITGRTPDLNKINAPAIEKISTEIPSGNATPSGILSNNISGFNYITPPDRKELPDGWSVIRIGSEARLVGDSRPADGIYEVLDSNGNSQGYFSAPDEYQNGWDDSSLDTQNNIKIASVQTSGLLSIPESPSIVSTLGNLAGSFVSFVGNAVGDIGAAVGGLVSSVVSGVSNVVRGVLGFIGDLFGIGSNLDVPSIGDASGGSAVAPVTIDLDGDGIELTSLYESSVFFDVDGDGYMEQTAWTSGDDGFLVIDLFNDGQIVFGEEINYTLWDDTATTDMEALRNVFDTNQDGVLDAGDDRFAEFKIWQDFNQNGYVDTDELKTLEQMGISAISIDSRIPTSETDGKIVAGNVVYDETAINWTNNNSGKAYDTALDYSIGGIRFDGDTEEFSINYEDGSVVSVYQGIEGTPVNIDAADSDFDVVIGTSGNDMITQSGSKDIIFDGGDGDDSLIGGSGNDWLYGGEGNDILHGGDGDDILFIDNLDNWQNIDGGDGEDIAVITSTQGMSVTISDYNIEKAFGNKGDDVFTTSGSVSVKLDGGAGHDVLTGADGDDELLGGAGDDILNGKAGNNILSGNSGHDTYIIELNPNTTTEIIGFDTRDQDEKINLEAFNLGELNITTDNQGTFINLGNNQFIKLTNTNLASIDIADFVFKAGTSPNIVKTIQGSDDGEVIKGSNIDDIIYAGGGSNYITTGRGDDIIYTNYDALDAIKITRQPGKTDVIYGFDQYINTQFTYFMGSFSGNRETGEGIVNGNGSPELWDEKTAQITFQNTRLDLKEFSYIKGLNDLNITTSNNDTVIDLGLGQTIILKDYTQFQQTNDYIYGRDSVFHGGTSVGYFVIDYNKINSNITSSSFIFSDGTSIASAIDDEMHDIDGSNALVGMGGNDAIWGYEGNDLLVGGDGDDVIYGGRHHDAIGGGQGHDELFGEDGNDSIWGYEGNDLIYGGEGNDHLTGDEGNDTLYGGSDKDTYNFEPGDGQDVIIDQGINNQEDILNLKATAGIDALILTRLEDNLIITFKEHPYDQITIKGQYNGTDDGIEIIRFSDNSEVYLASLGAHINGTNVSDTLYGTMQDDIIEGGRGNDLVLGSEGNDQYIFNIGDGHDIIDETGNFSNADSILLGSGITLSDVSHEKIGNDLIVTFSGSSNDSITVKNHYNSDNSRIEAIRFSNGDFIDLVTTAANINGNDYNNTLAGSIFNDNLFGGDGVDVLEGGKGADAIDGGDGEDIISYRHSSGSVSVNLDQNTASGGDAEGDVYTNIEGVEGSAFDDSLTGDTFANRLYGLAGNDVIHGLSGNDKIFAGEGDDYVIGGDGDDYIDGGSGADILEGNNGNDSIFGGAGGDILLGGSGDDYLSGGTEGDVIDGGVGNDRMTTGFGDDTLTGGTGVDNFNISKSANIEDTITDFDTTNGETIDLWAFSHIKAFDDLMLSQSGNDTLIDLGDRQILRIKNTLVNDLNTNHFTFREKPVEFIVNNDRNGDQTNPAVTELSNGNFVITWTTVSDYFEERHYTSSNGTPYTVKDTFHEIQSRIFEADGTPQGNEFEVSFQPTGLSPYSSVTELANGGFVVVWNSRAVSEDNDSEIAMQLFDASGNKVYTPEQSPGSPVIVNTSQMHNHYEAKVTTLDNGNFVVTWYGHPDPNLHPEGNDYDVMGQLFNSSGSRINSEFLLSSISLSHEFTPAISSLADGKFVAVWFSEEKVLNSESGSVEETFESIEAQLFDANGNKIGEQFYISEKTSATIERKSDPDVTSLDNGNFVVTWTRVDRDGVHSYNEISGQIFNPDGQKIGDEFTLESFGYETTRPDIQTLEDGGFILVFESETPLDDNWKGIFGQRFRFDGVKMGDEFHINDYTWHDQVHPAVATLGSGDFVVTWDSDFSTPYHRDIAAKLFAVDEIAVNKEVPNHTIASGQEFSLHLPYDTFIDAQADALTYSASLSNGLPLPDWLNFDPVSLSFNGTPSVIDQGSIGIRITATDGSATITETFNINIEPLINVYDKPQSSPEIQVNTYEGGSETESSVVTLSDGSVVATWISHSSTKKIYGQKLNDLGQKEGGEFLIHESNGAAVSSLKTLPLENGGFWSAWIDTDRTISIKQFDNQGIQVENSNIIVIDNIGTEQFIGLDIAQLEGGNIVVSGVTYGAPSSGTIVHNIYHKVFSEDGSTIKEMSAIDSNNLASSDVNVVGLHNGDYLVSWSVRSTTDYNSPDSHIVAGRFDTEGESVGSQFVVDAHEGRQMHPVAVALDNGGFMVAWTDSSGRDSDLSGVFAQIYDQNNQPSGSSFQVNTEDIRYQYLPDMIKLDNGHIVVAWQSEFQDGDGYGIYAQILDQSGNKIDGEFLVNDVTADDQNLVSLTALPGGKFTATWTGVDTSSSGIFSKTFTDSGQELVGTFTKLYGTEDNDKILGNGVKNDFLGKGGHDIFVIAQKEDKTDIIRDLEWELHNDDAVFDRIDLSVYTDIKSFSDIAPYITEVLDPRSNTSIDLGNGHTLLLENVPMERLTEDHFIFYQAFNAAPQIFNGMSDQSALVGSLLELTIPDDAFFDLEGDTIAYTASLLNGGPLPEWLSFNPATGMFSGTPQNDHIDSLDLKLTASDGQLQSSAFFKINVSGTLVLVKGSKAIGYVGDLPDPLPIDDVLVASTSDSVTLVLTLSDALAGTLRAGSFNSIDGVLTLTGTVNEVNAALESLNFNKSATFDGSVEISSVLSDGFNPDYISHLTVQPNMAPVAVNDVMNVFEDSTFVINPLQLLANDRDAEDFSPEFGSITIQPEHGSLVDQGGGTYLYTPNADYTGIDSLTYSVVDALGAEATAQLILNVSSMNDAPTAIGINSTLVNSVNDPTLIGQLLVEDIDPDDTHSFSVDDTRFEVVDGILKLVTSDALDSETQPSVVVNITATDFYGESVTQAFLIASPVSGDVMGTANDDVIVGLSSDDIFLASAGADLFDGGNGNDSVSYVSSTSGVMISLASPASNTGDAAGDHYVSIESVIGSSFADTFYGDVNQNTVHGGDGQDSIYGNGGHDYLTGGDGNDMISGGSGNDTIEGGAGDDTLYGEYGADIINGGEGADAAHYGNSSAAVSINLETGVGLGGDAEGDTLINIETVIGSIFNDELTGNSEDNKFLAGDGDDFIIGGAGMDQIYASNGNDVLIGSEGADILVGGIGFDSFRYDSTNDSNNASRDRIEDFTKGEDVIDVSRIGIASLNDITITQSGGSTIVTSNINGFEVTLTGLYTLDESDFVFSSIQLIEINGTSANDDLMGTSVDDTLNGQEGNDMLEGGAGADVLNGGLGSDTATYATSTTGVTVSLLNPLLNTGDAIGDSYYSIENIVGSYYDDMLYGDASNNTISGRSGNDRIYGNGLQDVLLGGDDDDIISGGGDNDIINGGAGNDTLTGESGADTLIGESGIDIATYWGSAESVTINLENGTGVGGDAEGDTLTGIENIGATNYDDDLTGDGADNSFFAGAGSDVIRGGGGIDRIYASDGDDQLFGEDGNDILVGSNGADQLTGGLGADIFRFSTAHSNSSTMDTILDFNQSEGDLIDLVGVGATGMTDITLIQVNGNTIISANDNDFEVELQGTVALTAGDFVWS